MYVRHQASTREATAADVDEGQRHRHWCLRQRAGPRTVEDYAKEVGGYVAKATKALPSVLLKGAHARGLGRIAFLIRNNTDDPIRGLRVEVRVPAKGVMALHEDETPTKDLPARPVMLGKAAATGSTTLGGVSLAGLTDPRYDYMTTCLPRRSNHWTTRTPRTMRLRASSAQCPRSPNWSPYGSCFLRLMRLWVGSFERG